MPGSSGKTGAILEGRDVQMGEQPADRGGGATFYSTLVEVKKVMRGNFNLLKAGAELAEDGAAPI